MTRARATPGPRDRRLEGTLRLLAGSVVLDGPSGTRSIALQIAPGFMPSRDALSEEAHAEVLRRWNGWDEACADRERFLVDRNTLDAALEDAIRWISLRSGGDGRSETLLALRTALARARARTGGA